VDKFENEQVYRALGVVTGKIFEYCTEKDDEKLM
jgi:hypothetical protein